MTTAWNEANDNYLSVSLRWLRLLLQRSADRRNPVPTAPSAPPPDMVDVRPSWWRRRPEALLALPPAPAARAKDAPDDIISETAAQIAALAKDMSPGPALESIREALGLSEYERDVLLLCAATELDTGIGGLLQAAYGQSRTSFAAAMSLFDDASWDVRSPDRPLRYWQLISTDEPMSNTSAIRIDERILHAIKGLEHLDIRLLSIVEPVSVPREPLPASQQRIADEAVDLIARAAAGGEIPHLQLVGPHSADRRSVAAVIAHTLGLRLYGLRTSSLGSTSLSEVAALARLWHRETLLSPAALLLDEDGDEDTAASRDARNAFARRTGGLLLASAADLMVDLPGPTLSLDVARPSVAEQYDLWRQALGSPERVDVGVLAEQFRLDSTEIHRIVASTALPDQPQEATRTLQAATRRSLRPRLQKLATWVRPVATWDTLVLPDNELRQLHDISEQVGHRSRVYSDWGFGARMNRGLGINALFAGESGTGKTMAAEVLANDLGLDLYRIDLSGVVDKYVGETPKHVRTIFDWGDAGEAILFFDEADAIFGKRSEVKDAHDRYANVEIDYLLQRMETYRGVAILATNMRDAVDPAFLRRLRFVVNFPFPSATDRERMWSKAFPADTPVGQLDYAKLSRIALTGAGITDAALAAAFRAAAQNRAVEMADVLDAVRAVLRKHNRPINEADFRIAAAAVPA